MPIAPTHNSEGLPALEITEDQKYLFDTRGWLLLPAVLDEADITAMRDYCYQWRNDRDSLPIHERSSLGGPLLRLIDHPAVLGFMNEFVADPATASEHGYGFRLENSFLALRKAGDTNFGPHGGSGIFQYANNSHVYQMAPEKNRPVFSGLTRAVWELNPVRKGEGGTLLLTGSHKAAFPTPASIQSADAALWDGYDCPAGSLLFFTEALCHSGAQWTNPDTDRVAIFNCYNTIGSRWHNWEPHPDALVQMNPLRRSLFRGVYCDQNKLGG